MKKRPKRPGTPKRGRGRPKKNGHGRMEAASAFLSISWRSLTATGGFASLRATARFSGFRASGDAQFEELETFARFGARLDEDTRKIIEHGRRIRSCLKQPELAPVSVPAQIAILLALTAALFDPVPIEKMTDAERAVREAAEGIAAEVCARFATAEKLSEEDRDAILAIAREALVPWKPPPSLTPEAVAGTRQAPPGP